MAVKQDRIILETIQRNVTYNQDISGSYHTNKTDQTSRFIFNLYINNRIMPKLVTYSITL